MILFDKTKEVYGYDPKDIPQFGRKLIISQCDYCNAEFTSTIRHISINTAKAYNPDLVTCSRKECTVQKRTDTNLIKYGAKSSFQNVEVRNKYKANFIKKHGVDNPGKVLAIQQKREDTCLEKYGNKTVLQNEEIKKKITATLLSKYGVDHPSKNPETAEKQRATTLERYGVTTALVLPESRKRLMDSFIASGKCSLYDGKTLAEVAEAKNIPYTTATKAMRVLGFDQFKKADFDFKNALENKLALFLDTLAIDYTFNRCLEGRRTDFIINNSIVIECDGLYWHSDKIVPKDYHKNKKLHYSTHGYSSLFFRSDEILNQFPIVCSIIKNRLNMTPNIYYARKTSISKLNKEDSVKFFKDNHLMSHGRGDTYALLSGNVIVAALQVLTKNKEANIVEVSRFCTAIDTSVVGGFSKLLKYVSTVLSPSKIISFVDLRYGDGHSLEKTGFTKESEYLSFKWTDYQKVYNRMKFPGKTGYEKGLKKIWDCGQRKYTITLK